MGAREILEARGFTIGEPAVYECLLHTPGDVARVATSRAEKRGVTRDRLADLAGVPLPSVALIMDQGRGTARDILAVFRALAVKPATIPAESLRGLSDD